MNAGSRHHRITDFSNLPEDRLVVDSAEGVSALLDGELAVHELDFQLQALEDDAGLRDRCEGYVVIGDVLRGGMPRRNGQGPHTFVAGVRSRLRSDEGATTPATGSVVPERVAAPAANDAVFRWKLVAGFASLAAVVAVGWGAIGQTQQGMAGSASQLALIPAAVSSAEPAQNVAVQESPAVLVSTPHGPVLRDPRLEQLLAEHRQFGGMSALQMPAGFLRDATQLADTRR